MQRRVPPVVVLLVVVAVFAAVAFSQRASILAFATAQAEAMNRVDAARARLRDTLPALFAAVQVPWPPTETFLRAIKEGDDGGPGVVELWARGKDQPQLTLIKSYPICAKSGISGPKRRQGDGQVPEGFYTIEKLNPQSSYHLSLRVDYPNESDRIRGRKQNGAGVDLGGDIMVHGACVTIGCIPLQDDPIEEVYLAVESTFGKQKTRIHIFPRRLDDAGLQKLLSSTSDEALRSFWRELAVGWNAFEKTKTVPRITVATDGAYVVQ